MTPSPEYRNMFRALLNVESAAFLAGVEEEPAAELVVLEEAELLVRAAGRVEVTTAEVGEGVKDAVPSSTVM
jgi:hypothetical protein